MLVISNFSLLFPPHRQCFRKPSFSGWLKTSECGKDFTVDTVQGSLTAPTPEFAHNDHSQEHSLSFSPRFAHWNVTQLLIG